MFAITEINYRSHRNKKTAIRRFFCAGQVKRPSQQGVGYQRNASTIQCLYIGLLYTECQVSARARFVYNAGGPFRRLKQAGTGFRRGFPTAVNASTIQCLYSRLHLRWWQS